VLRRVDARTFVSVDVPPFVDANSARRWLEREGAAVLAGQRAVIARIVDEVRVDVRQVPRVSLLRAPRPASASLVPERPPMVVEDHVDNGNQSSEDPPP
jgi:hypothetical protein